MRYSTPVLDKRDETKTKRDRPARKSPQGAAGLRRPPTIAGGRVRRRGLWVLLRERRAAYFACGLLAIVVLASVGAPLLTPYPMDATDLQAKNLPPSFRHPFGTDDLGRDFFTRVVHGGRISIGVGVLSIIFTLLLGVAAGGAAGYYGRLVDAIVMRAVDAFLAVPVFLVILFLSGIIEPGVLAVAALIAMVQWTEVARLMRAVVLSAKEDEFIDAARALGIPNRRILFHHVLPHARDPMLVAATLGFAQAIMLESGLSFLGFGIRGGTSSWGGLLENAQGFLEIAPWLAVFPGLLIFVTVASCYIVGDFLRWASGPARPGGD